MTSSPTIVRALLAGAASAGIRPITPVGAPDALDRATERRLWQELARAVPDLGLRAAVAWPSGGFRALEYLMRTAPSMRVALDELVRFNRVLHGRSVFEHPAADPERYTVRFVSPWRDPGLCAVGAEFALASLCRLGNEAVGTRLVPERVTFRHPRPAHGAALVDAFGVAPVFDADDDAVVFGSDALARQPALHDPVLHDILEEVLRAELARLPPTDLRQRVRREMGALLPSREPKLDEVARALGVSGRTLQSRLERDGTTFRAELDLLRESLAKSYLRDSDLEVPEVAALLAYADESSFRRAFKRWTGRTPSRYRKEARR